MSSRTRDLPVDLPDGATRAAAGIAVVLVAQLMLVLDATVVNVALPHIGTDLGFGAASLSWVLNAYTLAFGGLLLLGGRLGDVLGRRRLFVVGLALFTLSSLLGGLAQSPGELVAARAAQGVGAALAAPSVLALLTTSAPDDAARSRAFALFAAVSSGGASVGLLLGGIVTDLGSWRWTMFINVPIGLAVLALVGATVSETPRRPGRFDVVGAATSTLGAVAIVWALIGAPEHGWTSARTLGGFALGVVLLAVLARTETRIAHPIIQPALLRDGRRVAALAMMALLMAGQLAVFFLVVQFDENVLGLGPVATGFAFLPLSLGIFTVSRITPRLVARFGAPPLLLAGATSVTTSYVLLSQLGTGSTFAGSVLLPMVLNGVGAGLMFMPLTSTVLTGVEPEHAGAASGLLQTMQQLGGAIGVAVIVSVYAAGAVPGEVVPGLEAAFLTAGLLGALAVATAATLVLRGRAGRRPAAAGGEPAALAVEAEAA
ncbi:MFS transporter [Nocardioides fonticola]|uniref:MFS transporter n=1 Tax=Nocardioides fonticola TaxID=450363 RepID=A0ABP7XNL4_9ACTN